MQQSFVYDGIVTILLLASVFFEHAFGVSAITYVLLMLLFTRKHAVFFACISLVLGIIADVLYLMPLGTTALIMNGALYIWYITKGVARLRMVLFFGLGLLVTILLSVIRHTQLHILTAMIVLFIGWFMEKRIFIHRDTGMGLHVGQAI